MSAEGGGAYTERAVGDHSSRQGEARWPTASAPTSAACRAGSTPPLQPPRCPPRQPSTPEAARRWRPCRGAPPGRRAGRRQTRGGPCRSAACGQSRRLHARGKERRRGAPRVGVAGRAARHTRTRLPLSTLPPCRANIVTCRSVCSDRLRTLDNIMSTKPNQSSSTTFAVDGVGVDVLHGSNGCGAGRMRQRAGVLVQQARAQLRPSFHAGAAAWVLPRGGKLLRGSTGKGVSDLTRSRLQRSSVCAQPPGCRRAAAHSLSHSSSGWTPRRARSNCGAVACSALLAPPNPNTPPVHPPAPETPSALPSGSAGTSLESWCGCRSDGGKTRARRCLHGVAAHEVWGARVSRRSNCACASVAQPLSGSLC